MIFTGLIHLHWWGHLLVALAMTHVTIAGVTIYLHRHQAHRALDLGPIPSHFFRFWLWLTTGMVTKEWAAVHRFHHARCETEEDPHSPQIAGINRVLWGGVGLYKKAANNTTTLERYGHGTPDDWLERHVYAPHSAHGILIMLVIDLLLFGLVPGALIWLTQMLWIPFWAAGVINGIGHYWGYRNFASEDAATNIVPWGILIGGEELHNNHHAYASSAKLSNKWYEFDIGWLYIRILEVLGQARVKKVAPRIRYARTKTTCDAETLQAVITHRYEVMANYTRTLRQICAEELAKCNLSAVSQRATTWLTTDASGLKDQDRAQLGQLLTQCKPLATVYAMRQELVALWARSTATQEQLVKQLNDWCHRAETSGIDSLQKFSRRLRCYA